MSALPQFFSARELAELRLPGLPGTQRSINRLRERHGWASREQGGRLLISIDALPAEAREAMIARLTPKPLALPTTANDLRRPVGRPSGTDFFTANPDVADAVISILARQQLAATRIMEHLEGQFDRLPEIHTLRRFITRVEATRKPLLDSFRDPDLYKSRYRMALGRADGGVTRANQIWELDSTRIDVMLKTGRRQILGLIDVYSRRANFMIAPSESGQSVRRLLIDTITRWGVMPDMVKTDNGSGFINASIVSALGALGIEHHRVAPGSGDKKPHIERVFGTLTRERFEIMPGYIGHNVAEAQKLRGRAKKETGRALILPELDEAQLQEIITNWLDGVYHLRVHHSTGMSPLTRYRASPGSSAAAPGADALMIALSALVGTNIVTKRGVVWKRGRYWSPALVPLIGRPVQVRRDEEDLGALFIFDEQGRFVDTAINHARAGLSESEFAATATAHQRQWMKEARADMRARSRLFSIEKARTDIIRRDAEAAGKVSTLPVSTQARETPMLDGFNAPATPMQPVRPTDDISARVARAQALIADHAAGHEVDPQRLEWAQAFVSGPAFKTFKATQALAGGTATIHQLRSV